MLIFLANVAYAMNKPGCPWSGGEGRPGLFGEVFTAIRERLMGLMERETVEMTDAGRTRPHVLLAEDDPVSRVMMTALLEKIGCVVIHAENGRQAVEQVRLADVDLVFMDIQMPVMDGLEATRRIRTASGLGDKAMVPVVAVTAFAVSGDREHFLAAGMDDYLPKPVNIHDLRSVLDRLGPKS